MISLYVGSISGYSGKTLISMGLGHRFKRDGLRVGYMKPVGILPVKVNEVLIDNDAWRIYRVLELKDSISEICPVVLTQELIIKSYLKHVRGLINKIERSYKNLSLSKDIMLVGGYGSIYTGSALGVEGIKVINRLKSKVVVVVKYEGEYVIDYILKAKKDLKKRFIGVILNKVAPEYNDDLKEYIIPFLKRKGVDIIGIIPHDPVIGSITVEELNEMLGGKILCGYNKMNTLVEQFLIGAMQVDKAIEYFKKTRRNAVIVGGDRSDIQLSAIESGTECLILTGDLYPSEIIISKAEEKDIPILLVRDDTYSVAKQLERLSIRLRLRDKVKVESGIRLVSESINFSLLYKKLGIVI